MFSLAFRKKAVSHEARIAERCAAILLESVRSIDSGDVYRIQDEYNSLYEVECEVRSLRVMLYPDTVEEPVK